MRDLAYKKLNKKVEDWRKHLKRRSVRTKVVKKEKLTDNQSNTEEGWWSNCIIQLDRQKPGIVKK